MNYTKVLDLIEKSGIIGIESYDKFVATKDLGVVTVTYYLLSVAKFKIDVTFTDINNYIIKKGSIFPPLINNEYLSNVNGYVDIGHQSDLVWDGTDTLSFSFWIKSDHFNVTGGALQRLFRKLIGVGPIVDFFIRTNGAIDVTFSSSGSTNRIRVFTTTAALVVGAWKHLVVTYDGSKTAAGIKIYSDGVLLVNSIVNDALTGSFGTTGPITLYHSGFSGALQGSTDEFSLWNTNLTPSDIDTLYNLGTPSDLVNHPKYTLNNTIWHRHDGDTGTTVTDHSPNTSHTGTLVGSISRVTGGAP